MPRTMPRARKRALQTEKPLKATLRARKQARKAEEPVKLQITLTRADDGYEMVDVRR
jgi:hypothetical protein